MYYIEMEMVNEISLSLNDHQVTHFMDDINGMEVKVYYHDILYKYMIDINNLIMEWISYMLWIDRINYNDRCKSCDNVRTRNVSEHKLRFIKHVISHGIAVIDNHYYNYQTLIMKWFKEIWVSIYLH